MNKLIEESYKRMLEASKRFDNHYNNIKKVNNEKIYYWTISTSIRRKY